VGGDSGDHDEQVVDEGNFGLPEKRYGEQHDAENDIRQVSAGQGFFGLRRFNDARKFFHGRDLLCFTFQGNTGSFWEGIQAALIFPTIPLM
jgi:hypothetical protein